MLTVYLAGGINGLSDAQCNDWRNETMQRLAGQFNFLNPMRRDYRGREGDYFTEVVEFDKEDIRNSHIVLVMAQVPSWGTAMEMLYAWDKGKQVISIVNPGRVSPWVKYHSTSLHYTLDEALEVLSKFR